MDGDGDGVISKHEMLGYFISINYAGTHNANNLQAYIEYLWQTYDIDGDGHLNLSETKPFFIDLIRHRPDLEFTIDKHTQWFAEIDVDGDGMITKHEMNAYFSQIHYSGKAIISIQSLVDELWFKYDSDRDGHLTHRETLPFF